jgi:iron complex transport system substrate-binding protein
MSRDILQYVELEAKSGYKIRWKKYLITILICILGCMLLVTGCGKSDSKKEPKSKSVTVTDSAGRSVEIPQPLEKVVVINNNAAEVICLLKVQDKVIGVGEGTIKRSYLKLQDKDIVSKGSKPSYEKIVELRPQVVISFSGTSGSEVAEKIEPAGIRVVLLDLYKPETYDSDFMTMAKMFGKEKEADAFLKWKAEQIAILDKAKDLKSEQRVSVFSMHTSSFESGKWMITGSAISVNQAIEMAGGISTARELKSGTAVSPEWVLQQNPGILVFTEDSDVIPNVEVKLGLNTNDLANAEKFKGEVIKNIVLSKTDAVQKDRVYIISNSILGPDKSFLGALYLAKWFYPDQFKGLDPDKVIKEYFEKWLGVPFKGKWAYPPVSK